MTQAEPRRTAEAATSPLPADVEPPPRVDVAEIDFGDLNDDLWTAEQAGSLASSAADARADAAAKFDPLADDSPTAKPQVVPIIGMPVLAVVGAEAPAAASDEPEESAEEPTIIRPSPLEQGDETADGGDEPATLERSVVVPAEEGADDSTDEPTVIRPSPKEQAESAEAAVSAEVAKPPAEGSVRHVRVELSPELLAQAKIDLGLKDKAPPTAAVAEVATLPPTEAPRDTETGPRRSRPMPVKPRSAPIWGLFLALVALVAASVVVALDKGWIGRLRAPAPTAAPTTATAAPTASEAPTIAAPPERPTDTPSTAEPPTSVPAPMPGGEPTAAPPASGEAPAAPTASSSAAPATTGGASATPADTGPPTTAPTAPTPAAGGAAPPGDPMSLPAQKGYLIVTASESLYVYVQGAQAGKTNEPLVVDCGPKFVRIGVPPETPPPGGGAGAVKWRSAGKSTVVACRATTTLAITTTP